MDKEETVRLRLYDFQGRYAALFFEGVLGKGSHSLDLEGNALQSGNYIARLSIGGAAYSVKLADVK